MFVCKYAQEHSCNFRAKAKILLKNRLKNNLKLQCVDLQMFIF